ncbi:MAG: sulfite exporter TauE/SafE family protein [Acidobacteriia bacterium]|nr:sulfite exporter TauE/SafE family protein [Terriglobia bacterium]
MQTVLIVLIIVVAFYFRYLLGFGFSMLFVPLGSMILDFRTVVNLAVILEVGTGVLMTFQYRKELRILDSMLLKAYAIFGAYCGLVIMHYVPTPVIILTSMVCVIAATLMFLGQGKEIRHTRINLGITGVLSGLLNSWSSMSGPPVVIYYYSSAKSGGEIKAALTGYFLVLYLVTLGMFVFSGEYKGFKYFDAIAVGFFAMLVMYVILGKLMKVTPKERLRQFALLFMIVVASTVIVETLVRMGAGR